jgi:hypothetical protein
MLAHVEIIFFLGGTQESRSTDTELGAAWVVPCSTPYDSMHTVGITLVFIRMYEDCQIARSDMIVGLDHQSGG